MTSTRAVLFAVSLALAGCSGTKKEEGPELQPVKGSVVYADGSAYTGGGSIEFNAVAGTSERALGMVDRDGNFTLTVIGGKGKREGAPAGDFSATIIPDQQDNQGAPPIRARGKYQIRAGENNELKVIIEKKR